MVSGLTKCSSTNIPRPPITPDAPRISTTDSSTDADARRAVRAMRASSSRSTRQFTANAALASSQMPIVADITRCTGGRPGTARHMPITAQNTASCVTRGFVSA